MSVETNQASIGGEYVVVARRYRPQSFDELIGQQHVAKSLGGAISSGRVGHAYLFTGARGVGKTSAARILAKALNCIEGPSPTSCNCCEICQSVASGEDVDVLEIDGASNRGIDEIRQLRQNAAVRPSRARFKIYIIDEVHMLTKEAFNALLKTLEEPPEHVKFIFATTEPNKIPITILSRCQRYDFAGIDAAAIRSRLDQIAANEGVDVAAEALQIIATRAAGSMRDSQSLLEQLLATGARSVSAKDVTDMLGLASSALLSNLVRPLVERDAARCLAELDTALAEGAEPGQLIDQLLGYFRDVMTQAVGCGPDALLHALPEQCDEVRLVGQKVGVNKLLAISQILDATAARLRVSTQARTLAEMAIVRICCLENLDEIAALIEHLKSGGSLPDVSDSHGPRVQSTGRSQRALPATEPGSEVEQPKSPGFAAAEGRSVSAHDCGSEASSRDQGVTTAGDLPEPAEPKGRNDEAQTRTVGDEALNQSNAEQFWQQAIQSLSGMTAEHAAEATAISVEPNGRLVASFPASRSICCDACRRPANLAKLEAALAVAFGRPVTLSLVLHEDNDVVDESPSPAISRQQQLAHATARPIVQKAMELFEVDPSQAKFYPPREG